MRTSRETTNTILELKKTTLELIKILREPTTVIKEATKTIEEPKVVMFRELKMLSKHKYRRQMKSGASVRHLSAGNISSHD